GHMSCRVGGRSRERHDHSLVVVSTGGSMQSRKGFTLIELLIVVVIIGILAAIAIPKFATTKDKAKLASVKTDLRNYMTAEEAFRSEERRVGDRAAQVLR